MKFKVIYLKYPAKHDYGIHDAPCANDAIVAVLREHFPPEEHSEVRMHLATSPVKQHRKKENEAI